MTRAERRHRAERAKARAQGYYGRWHMKPDVAPKQRARLLGIYARSPKVCSRWCCGNPRRHFHQKTLQEQRVEIEGPEVSR